MANYVYKTLVKAHQRIFLQRSTDYYGFLIISALIYIITLNATRIKALQETIVFDNVIWYEPPCKKCLRQGDIELSWWQVPPVTMEGVMNYPSKKGIQQKGKDTFISLFTIVGLIYCQSMAIIVVKIEKFHISSTLPCYTKPKEVHQWQPY